jgi:hypothetical protein
VQAQARLLTALRTQKRDVFASEISLKLRRTVKQGIWVEREKDI